MEKAFVFVYFMVHDEEKVNNTIKEHVDYWEKVECEHKMVGPFADQSGGMILFSAGSFSDAMKIVAKDPFVMNDLLDQQWVKEWMVK